MYEFCFCVAAVVEYGEQGAGLCLGRSDDITDGVCGLEENENIGTAKMRM